MTCVDKKILEGLGIPPVGDTQVRTPSGSAVQQVYPCGIAFPGAGIPSLERMFVIGADLDGQKIIGLLGRDLLAGALLVYNGIGGSWSLSV